MTYTLGSARALCNADEIELIAASFPGPNAPLTRVRLIAKLMRARRLRDKYRDLYRRQRLANRSRTGTKFGARPGTNARTGEKARLFDETLKRFEAKLEKLDAAGRKEAAKAQAQAKVQAKAQRHAAPPRARRAGQSASVPRAGFVGDRARQANLRQRLQRTGATKIRSHVRAQGRRRQARRDAR